MKAKKVKKEKKVFHKILQVLEEVKQHSDLVDQEKKEDVVVLQVKQVYQEEEDKLEKFKFKLINNV